MKILLGILTAIVLSFSACTIKKPILRLRRLVCGRSMSIQSKTITPAKSDVIIVKDTAVKDMRVKIAKKQSAKSKDIHCCV